MLDVSCGQGITQENFIDRNYYRETYEDDLIKWAETLKQLEADNIKQRKQTLKFENDRRAEREALPITWEEFEDPRRLAFGKDYVPDRLKEKNNDKSD